MEKMRSAKFKVGQVVKQHMASLFTTCQALS
jgi:heat shock protein HspQ